MNDIIRARLASYKPANDIEEENATKEIIQEIALYGLWRAKFLMSPFSKAVRVCESFISFRGFQKIWILCCSSPIQILTGRLISKS